ncbi:MAG: polysaccharide deacetylase family protein [Chloroflexota bacterium]
MHLPILMYHSLDETGSRVSIAPYTFERQLRRLRDSGYSVLPLGEALAGRASTSAARHSTPRVAALTFDDGYASVYQIAAPLLANFGWRATLFPVSDYIGSHNQWPGQASFVPRAQLLSWTQLNELAGAGWEIGAHTRTHPDLTRLAPHELQAEVVGGKRILEERLGRTVDLFAYPSGRYDARVRTTVRHHFRAACTTDMGIASETSPWDALERIEMWDFARPGTHWLLGSKLMSPYVAACRAARMLKSTVTMRGIG